MPFNSSKFMVLRMTADKDRKLQDSTMLFTPDYSSPIEEFEVVRDLGLMLDSDGSFSTQRLLAQKKALQKCSWVLRTFRSREPELLKSLWKSLIQPIQDYGSQVWSPVGRSGEIAWQEKPLRLLTRRMRGLSHLNYWDRLTRLKMISTERRTERYKIIYMWKIINGLVPDIGVQISSVESSRTGLTVRVPPKSGSKEIVQTLKDQYFTTHGPRLFNSLPKSLRERGSTLDSFKERLDQFLMSVPDRPVLAGYQPNNPGLNGWSSNSIMDWVRNYPSLLDWSPVCSVNKECGCESGRPGCDGVLCLSDSKNNQTDSSD